MKTEGNKLVNMVKGKCPNCGKGDVFVKDKPFFTLPVMKDDCDVCNYHFDREPGYFLGAMYISYGLAVFEGIITFLVCYFFFPNLETFYMALIPCITILILSMRNYKWSRVFYMYIFPN